MDINDPIKTTVEEIRKVLNIENVIGETIETDEFLMLPVTRMGMGFGAGMGEGKGQDDMGGSGAGAGGAAGIEPIAMVVVHKGVSGHDGVKVMSLKDPDMISEVISEIKDAAVEVMGKGRKVMHEKKEYSDDEKKVILKEESAPNKETLKAEIPSTK